MPVKPNYPTIPDVNAGSLPDPFKWPDGHRVSSRDEWPARAAAWLQQIVELEYGGMPPAPESVSVESRCHAVMRRWDDAAKIHSYGVRCTGGAHAITISAQVIYPDGDGPYPVLIAGDGCWSYLTDAMMRQVVDRGFALVIFNRTELAEDLVYPDVPDKYKRSGGLYDVYPDERFGALSAWAWGYHRMVDLVAELPFIDSSKIAVTGHSRGAKTVLLAGATDERIALVHDNASCAGGAAAFRYVGHGGESLSIIKQLPSWFGDGLSPYIDDVDSLPFDQHCLLASIAPRSLLLTYATDDRWSNPEGMVQSARATQAVYRYLGAGEEFAYHLRPGDHFFYPEDLERLLAFMAWRWQGGGAPKGLNEHPYDHLPAPFDWTAPENLL